MVQSQSQISHYRSLRSLQTKQSWYLMFTGHIQKGRCSRSTAQEFVPTAWPPQSRRQHFNVEWCDGEHTHAFALTGRN